MFPAKKTQPSSKLKNASSANSITNFFTKSENKPSIGFPVNESTKPSPPVTVSHLSDSALFSGCPPGVKYDIALVVRNQKQLSEGAINEILSCRDNLPYNFAFPSNNKTSSRQCTFDILNASERHFLRYSVSQDGVYCVHCVLFSTNTQPKKYHLLPERDWSNVHKTCKKHLKIPTRTLYGSNHWLCFQKSTDFMSIIGWKMNNIACQLDAQR